MLTTVQPRSAAHGQRVLGAVVVRELAVAVVVAHEQPERRPVGAAGVAQHGDVAVRVATGHHRPPSDAAPDAHRLLGPVVEELDLRLVDEIGPVVARRPVEPDRAADDPLGRDAVQVLGERPHEVAVAARGDVGREPVGLEVAQQLDHRREGAGQVGAAERRVGGVGEPGPDPGVVRLDRQALEGMVDGAHQQLQVGVVAPVVLHHRRAEPLQVVVDARPGTADGRRGTGRRGPARPGG